MDEQALQIAGLETIAVGDPAAASFVFVLLHGFAMRPEDLAPFAHSLGLPGLFLFPRGPIAARALPTGTRGFAWWDIDPAARATALARGARDFVHEHPPDLPRSRALLGAFLDQARAQFDDRDGNRDATDRAARTRPLFLGGFSQGGMLACDAFLRAPLALAGLVLLSASRIAFDEWSALPRLPTPLSDAHGAPLVFISHGRADPDLAFGSGVALRDYLTGWGAGVTWVEGEQGHEIPLVVWRALRKFIAARLGGS